jgi:hypothetical protein
VRANAGYILTYFDITWIVSTGKEGVQKFRSSGVQEYG